MLNPVVLSRAIKDTFADYVATTLSIADERYAELLKAELRKDGIIAKGPYLELGDAYKTGATIRELIADGVMSPLFERLGQGFKLSRPLYVHQELAVCAAANGDNMIVTTGTGSGKTECFLMPDKYTISIHSITMNETPPAMTVTGTVTFSTLFDQFDIDDVTFRFEVSATNTRLE